jgi:hypothetical protein
VLDDWLLSQGLPVTADAAWTRSKEEHRNSGDEFGEPPEEVRVNPELGRRRAAQFDETIRELNQMKLLPELGGIRTLWIIDRYLPYLLWPSEIVGFAKMELALHDPYVPRSLKRVLRSFRRSIVKQLYERAAPTRHRGVKPKLSPAEQGQLQPTVEFLTQEFSKNAVSPDAILGRLAEGFPSRTRVQDVPALRRHVKEFIKSNMRPARKARGMLSELLGMSEDRIERTLNKGKRKGLAESDVDGPPGR